jgi:hypothetical protein
MDSIEVPPAGQRQMSTNTCFICHCPNQSEHHATLPNIIINYSSVFKPYKKIPPASFPFLVPNVEGVWKILKISFSMIISSAV